MSQEEQLAKLQESLRGYQGTIQSFEYARARLRELQKGTTDAATTGVDRALDLNQRTLDSLDRSLAKARGKLERVISRR